VPKTKINRPQKRGEEKKERYINFLLTARALSLCSGRVGGHIITTRWGEKEENPKSRCISGMGGRRFIRYAGGG